MFLSKLIIVSLFLFLFLSCGNSLNYSVSPVNISSISYYKGKYTVTLETNKNVYDMYINYDNSVKYKLSTDSSYTTVLKSSIKYNSISNFFLLPLSNEQQIFELKFKDKGNFNVKLLDKDGLVVDVGLGVKY